MYNGAIASTGAWIILNSTLRGSKALCFDNERPLSKAVVLIGWIRLFPRESRGNDTRGRRRTQHPYC